MACERVRRPASAEARTFLSAGNSRRARLQDSSMTQPALEILATWGPDLRNGLTNYAPIGVGTP
jgi:hypothetical protein